MLKTTLEKELPNWVRNLFYAILLLETITAVIIYHAPNFLAKVIVQFI